MPLPILHTAAGYAIYRLSKPRQARGGLCHPDPAAQAGEGSPSSCHCETNDNHTRVILTEADSRVILREAEGRPKDLRQRFFSRRWRDQNDAIAGCHSAPERGASEESPPARHCEANGNQPRVILNRAQLGEGSLSTSFHLPSSILHFLNSTWCVIRGTWYRFLTRLTAERDWPLLIACLFLANAPDFDFIPGMFIEKTHLFHRGISHSFGAAVIVSLFFASILSLRRRSRLSLAATLSHLRSGASVFFAAFLTVFKRTNRHFFQFEIRNPKFEIKHACKGRFKNLASSILHLASSVFARARFVRTYTLCFLAYTSHIFLDWLNVAHIGVMMFWPFSNKPVHSPFMVLGGQIDHSPLETVTGIGEFLRILYSKGIFREMFLELTIIFTYFAIVTLRNEMRQGIQLQYSKGFIRCAQAVIFLIGFIVT